VIQLFAATIFVVICTFVMIFVAKAARKPYDQFDLWGIAFAALGFLVGVGRIVWIAFK